MAPFKLRKSRKKNGTEPKRESSVPRKDPKSPGTSESVNSSDQSSDQNTTNSSSINNSPIQNKPSNEYRKQSNEFINRPNLQMNTNNQNAPPPPQFQPQSQMGTPNSMQRQLPLIPTAGQSLSPIEATNGGLPNNNNNMMLRSPPQGARPLNNGSPIQQFPPQQSYQQKPLPPSQFRASPNGSTNSSNPFLSNNVSRNVSNPTVQNQLFNAIQNFTPWTRIKLTASPFPRYRHTSSSVISEQGHVFVMGGLREGSVYGDLWALNSSTYEAKSIENFDGIPAPRVGHNSCLCGNAFIVFGGDTIQTNEQGELDNDLYLFNINSLKWTIPHPQGERPCGRYGHTIGVVAKTNMQSKLYLFGGQLDSKIFKDLWVFDLSTFRKPTSHWEKVNYANEPNDFENLPPPLTNHSMIIYNYKLYIFGGSNLQNLSNDLFCYDPNNNMFTKMKCTGDIPPPIEEHSTTVIKNLMMVYGGKNSKNETMDDLYIINLNNLHWTKVESFLFNPGPRCGHSLTAIFNYSRKSQNNLINNELDDSKKFNNIQVNPTKISANALSSTVVSSSKNKLLIMGGDQLDYCTPKVGSFEKSTKDENFGTMVFLFDVDLYNEWSVKFKNYDLWDDALPSMIYKPIVNNNNSYSPVIQPPNQQPQQQFIPGSAPVNSNNVGIFDSQPIPSSDTIPQLTHKGNGIQNIKDENELNGGFSSSRDIITPNGIPQKDSTSSLEAFSTPPTTTNGSPQSISREVNNSRLESKIQNTGIPTALVGAGAAIAGSNTTLSNNKSVRDSDLLDSYVNSSTDLLDKMTKNEKLKKLDIPTATEQNINEDHQREMPTTPVQEDYEKPVRTETIPLRSPKREEKNVLPLTSPQDGLSPTTADLYVNAISSLPSSGPNNIDKELEFFSQPRNHNEEDFDNKLESENYNNNKSESYNKSETYNVKPETYNNKSESYSNKSEIYHNKPENFDNKSELEKLKFTKLIEDLENELGDLKLEMNNQARIASDHINELEQNNHILEMDVSRLNNLLNDHKTSITEKESNHNNEIQNRDLKIQELHDNHEFLINDFHSKKQVELNDMTKSHDEEINQLKYSLEKLQEELKKSEEEKEQFKQAATNAAAASVVTPQINDYKNDDEVENLRLQLLEKEKIIDNLRNSQDLHKEIIGSSSPIQENNGFENNHKFNNSIKLENIELQSEIIKLKANNETLNQKFLEFEPIMNNSMIELEELNNVIIHQRNEIMEFEENNKKFDELMDDLTNLQTENDLLKKELTNLKNQRKVNKSNTNEKINNISTDLTKLISIWKIKKDISNDLDRSLISDNDESFINEESGDLTNRSILSNISNVSNSKAFNQLQYQINELISINKDQELKNSSLQETINSLSKELKESEEKLNKFKEFDNLEENYRNAINSVKNTGKALEISQKELNKQKELNNQLRFEVDNLKTKHGNLANDNEENDLKNAHYDFKIKDLEAELFIIKEERDELKENVLSLKKKLMTGAK